MQNGVITFSRNAFFPLTNVCRNDCGYCIFKTAVHDSCVMAPAQVEKTLEVSAAMGCTEALFTFGEKPEEEPGFSPFVRRLGYNTILDYCYAMCERAIDVGLLPHTNAGILTYDELSWLKEVNASMGLMLETTAEIPAHARSPGKKPEVRIAMMEDAGKLQIPFTTGLLIGIGEGESDREDSLRVIADLHRRFGHIQEVIIQNFCPKEGTAMAGVTSPVTDEIAQVIQMAREILPDDIAVQIPPNLADAAELIPFGVNDLGGVSPITIDYVNPEHAWPQIQELQDLVGENALKERLCIYSQYVEKGWYPKKLQPLITHLTQEINTRTNVTG